MYRYRELLTSFLASAMLTTALMPVPGAASLASIVDPAAIQRAMSLAMAQAPAGYEGSPVSGVSAAPAAVTPVSLNAAAGLTPARVTQVVSFTRQYGRAGELSPRVGAPLGVVTPGIPYMARQTVLLVEQRRHVWMVHESENRKILVFSFVEQRNTDFWVLEMDGTVSSGATLRDGVLTLLPADEARRSFAAEVDLWNRADLTPPPAQVAAAAPGA